MRLLAALLFLLGACAVPEGRAQELIVVPPTRIDRDELMLGNCRSEDQVIDLRRMMIHEHRWLDVIGEHGRTRTRVSGESLVFERRDQVSPEGRTPIVVVDIGRILGGNEDLDIDLRLASVEGRFAVFWRETFQHRSYRQGLLEIVGETVVALCEGRGGIDASH